jgi:hypothetical protein
MIVTETSNLRLIALTSHCCEKTSLFTQTTISHIIVFGGLKETLLNKESKKLAVSSLDRRLLRMCLALIQRGRKVHEFLFHTDQKQKPVNNFKLTLTHDD